MRRRQAHIFDKEKHGHYVEPEWVSRRLFEVEDFGYGVYDPACGWGRIPLQAINAGYVAWGSDVVKRFRKCLPFNFRKCDFLADQTLLLALLRASVVCNPPFDHVEEFCRNAVNAGAYKVAMICLVRRLNAAHWLQELPLRRIWLLTPRPSMPPGSWIAKGNKPGGGTQDFCWLVFERGYTGKPEVGWLYRDQHD